MSETKRETVETLLRFVGERCGWCCGPGGEWWLSTDGKTLADTATDAHLRELLGACGDWAAEKRIVVTEQQGLSEPRMVYLLGPGLREVYGWGPTRADAWADALAKWEEATR